MRQLVGNGCVLCGGRIGSVLEGHFCARCGCPVHGKCPPSEPKPYAPAEPGERCPTCGAPAQHAKVEQAKHANYDRGRELVRGGPHQKKYALGVLGGAYLALCGMWDTLNPRVDGRLFNTAPTIGFDLWLPVGIAMMGVCLFRLVRGR